MNNDIIESQTDCKEENKPLHNEVIAMYGFPMPSSQIRERFFEQFQRGDDDECWLWQGRKNKAGYGVLYSGSGTKLAHRLSYRIFIGQINYPSITQICGNRSCVNPNHLSIKSPYVKRKTYKNLQSNEAKIKLDKMPSSLL